MSKLRSSVLFTFAGVCAFAVLAASVSADTPIAAPGPLFNHGFAQIGLQVGDLGRAVAFYRDVLGLRYLFNAGGMVFFQVGEARLMIEHGQPGRSTTLYFDDADLERTQARLEAHGVRFAGPVETVQRTPTYDLKLLEFSDPDGNPLALMGQVGRKE